MESVSTNSSRVTCDECFSSESEHSGDTLVMEEEIAWGIPLYCNPEQDDEESLEDMVKLSLLEEGVVDSATLGKPTSNDSDKENTDQGMDSDTQDGGSEGSRVVVDAAVMKESVFVLPSFLRKTRSNKHFYKKMYLDRRKPQRPHLQPLHVTINYTAVPEKWKVAINKAISDIQNAAPGLHFERTPSKSAWICFVQNWKTECATEGSLRFPLTDNNGRNKAVIHLTDRWEQERLHSTAEHELLHALGFEHEHERRDAGHYLTVLEKYKGQVGVIPDPYIKPLTPFDRHSIMLYRIGKRFELHSEKDMKYPENRSMSELDKIALNMLYPPSVTETYNPHLTTRGMYYCGRQVMDNHNQPEGAITNMCGPSNGPNCPACRVLSKPINMGHHQWQGRSGFVYCGNDGCGPDMGNPCPECLQVVLCD